MGKALNPLAIQRSSTFHAVNWIGKGLGALGARAFRLDAEQILKRARSDANFEGAFPGQLEEGLHRLVDSIVKESRPNPFARLALNKLFTRTACARMKMEQSLAADKSIEEAPVRSPVFILGMPRTGSSILHALLNEDPAHRSPLAWECLHPWPASTPDTFKNSAGLRTTQKEFQQLFQLVPDFQKKHHMEADAPQECIGINLLDFNSFQTSAQVYIPSYMKWFADEADRLETMRFHKRFLQWLQSGGVKSERWLLKSPIHMMRLPELLEVYPDACIISTHRTPTKVLPSATSLISSVRSLYSNHEDRVRSGREQLDTWQDYLERFLEARVAVEDSPQMVDVLFDDFVVDQMGVVRKIYQHFGWTLSDEAEQNMIRFLEAHPPGKHGKHEYVLEDFGLNATEVNERFAPYNSFLEKMNKL